MEKRPMQVKNVGVGSSEQGTLGSWVLGSLPRREGLDSSNKIPWYLGIPHYGRWGCGWKCGYRMAREASSGARGPLETF